MFRIVTKSESNLMKNTLINILSLKLLQNIGISVPSNITLTDNLENIQKNVLINKLLDINAVKILYDKEISIPKKLNITEEIKDYRVCKLVESLDDIASLKILGDAGMNICKEVNLKLDSDEDTEDFLNDIDGKLGTIAAFKYLQNSGYNIGNINIDIQYFNEDMYIRYEIFKNVLDIVAKGEYEFIEATNERGEVKGYELYVDEDDGICTEEIVIKQKDIMKFMKSIKNIEDEKAFKELVYMLDTSNQYYWDDYSHWEPFIPDDLEGIEILATDYQYINYNLIVALVDLINYCREENKKREVKRNNEKPAA